LHNTTLTLVDHALGVGCKVLLEVLVFRPAIAFTHPIIVTFPQGYTIFHISSIGVVEYVGNRTERR
jgi:hypothetical protein